MYKILHLPTGKYLKHRYINDLDTWMWLECNLKIVDYNLLLTFSDNTLVVAQSNTTTMAEFERVNYE